MLINSLTDLLIANFFLFLLFSPQPLQFFILFLNLLSKLFNETLSLRTKRLFSLFLPIRVFLQFLLPFLCGFLFDNRLLAGSHRIIVCALICLFQGFRVLMQF